MSDTPRTDAHQEEMEVQDFDIELAKTYTLARQLERENAELLERLQERTKSHIHASQRDVQTIQQQAVEIDRLKSVNAEMLEALVSLCSHDSTCGCEVSADESQRWAKACALVAREKGETK